MRKPFITHANNYTLYGVLIGLIFPVIFSVFDSWSNYDNCRLQSIMKVQSSHFLYGFIDSLPFLLGIFARFFGIKLDKLNAYRIKLEAINKDLIIETDKYKKEKNQLRKQNKVMEEDLEAARIMQTTYLPVIPDYNPLEIDYRCIPMKEVGGDFLSIIKLKEGGVGIFIGDVTGHGISAAIVTSLVKIATDRACRDFGLNPKMYLKKLNSELINLLPECSYLTAIYCSFTKTGDDLIFTFSRGAHPYPILWRSDTKKAELLMTRGVPIGYDEDSEFENKSIKINAGDRIFLFTDGILEVRNKNVDILDFDGLLDLIIKVNGLNLSISETLDSIIHKIELYSEGIPVKDDRVIIGIEAKFD